DQAVLREKVKRAVDRAIGDRWVPLLHALEDLARGEMPLGILHDVEDDRALRGIAIGSLRSAGHDVSDSASLLLRPTRAGTSAIPIVENESRYRQRKV